MSIRCIALICDAIHVPHVIAQLIAEFARSANIDKLLYIMAVDPNKFKFNINRSHVTVVRQFQYWTIRVNTKKSEKAYSLADPRWPDPSSNDFDDVPIFNDSQRKIFRERLSAIIDSYV